MKFRGFQKLSMVDFPGQLCATLFVGGCNMRCAYCHNASLVLNKQSLPFFSEAEILSFLETRRQKLDGVCITGGEPTLHPDLFSFISKIKQKGFLVKLDTNGSNPTVLLKLIEHNLLDYIAMDVKEIPKNYKKLGAMFDSLNISQSILILLEGKVPYEFRLTAVPEVTNKESIYDIAKLIKGADKFCLQQFIPGQDMFNMTLSKTFSKEDLERIAIMVKKYVKKVEVRA